MKNFNTQKLTLSALFLTLALLMPFLTGQIPAFGNKLLPMHIPVLLCGFVCGWQYGLIVGFIAPLLRHLLFHMPPLLSALTMAFELAAYGFSCGILYKAFGKNIKNIYLTLILSMIFGRIVWGIASFIIYSLLGNTFTVKIFIVSGFVNAIPGIIIQIILIPVLVLTLERKGLIKNE